MTESQLNAFRSEFDPQTLADSLRADPSPKNKAREFAVLKTSEFLVYTRGEGRVSVLNDRKKQAFVAAFTCREEMDKWPFDRAEPAVMTFTALQNMVEGAAKLDGLVIDPFGRALHLNRGHLADIEQTLRAATPRRELKMRGTRDYPIGLPLAVGELCESHPEVYRVWLLAARGESDTADHKLMVVDFDGKPEELFPHLAKAVRLYLRQGEQLELLKADITLLRIAEQAAKPIYEKK
ncbi:MAG: enhanced serine sensitivity protein SseB C-terminal domain-containing protein [Clostridia bacterium]|nr:enhanced serine sensitivity protein SseB C-terminal domain-containing protein [Clostridia bacterium]